jgi:hypothetical protein
MEQESVSARMVYLAHEEIYRGFYTTARSLSRAHPRRDA